MKENYGRTPLWWAAANGHEAVVKLLLATGQVEADSKDKHSRTPLSRAATNGHEAVVKLLLATGQVEADSKDNYGQTPLRMPKGKRRRKSEGRRCGESKMRMRRAVAGAGLWK